MSEDLISYKDHGRFERSRPYCSVKCYLCCVNKQPNREKSVRTIFKSLPNLVFESRNSPTTTPRRIFDDKMVRQTVDEPIELLKIDDMVERLFDMVAPPLKTSKRLSSFSLNTPEVTPRKSPVALLTKVETSSALEIQPSQPLAIVELSSSSSSHFATRNFSLSRKESARLSKSSRKIRLNDLETEQSKVIAASPPPKPKPRRNAAEKAETTEKSVPMPVVDVTVSIGQPVSEKHNCGEGEFVAITFGSLSNTQCGTERIISILKSFKSWLFDFSYFFLVTVLCKLGFLFQHSQQKLSNSFL